MKYSAESVKASRVRPGTMLRSSEEAGWESMLVQTFKQPTNVDAYETLGSRDALLVFVLEGSYELESFSSSMWRKASYRPGLGGFTAPFTVNRLRWNAQTASTAKIARLYLPQQYFAESYDALRPVGRPSTSFFPDALSLSDPTCFSVVKAALAALEIGESDLYADACARFLATHLICKFERWSDDLVRKTAAADLPDRRLRRVLELMQQQFASALTINGLAREAGISPFHFSRTFKAKIGVTPHEHIRRLRLRHARTLLVQTDLSIFEVAVACGYAHDGHFAAAFQKAFGRSPNAFRKLLHT